VNLRPSLPNSPTLKKTPDAADRKTSPHPSLASAPARRLGRIALAKPLAAAGNGTPLRSMLTLLRAGAALGLGLATACDDASLSGGGQAIQIGPIAETDEESGVAPGETDQNATADVDQKFITAQVDGKSRTPEQRGAIDLAQQRPRVEIDFREGCLAQKADQYNVVLVLDASASQSDTDPTNLRIAGADLFVDRMAGFAARHPEIQVNAATVTFNFGAQVGSGWNRIVPPTAFAIEQEIGFMASALQPATHFIPALDAAAGLLQQRGASPMNRRQRNFVVFLTDGEPNLVGSPDGDLAGGETIPGIYGRVAQLTQAFGAAMIAVGSGMGLSFEGEQVLAGMAMPAQPIVSPSHVGRYIRVATPFDMMRLGDILFDAVSRCE
jgi:hypothetical protein